MLPRAVLRPGNRVLIVDDERRLRFRDVEVLRTVGDRTIISAGLERGERVCISPIVTAVDGMRVRVVGQPELAEETAL